MKKLLALMVVCLALTAQAEKFEQSLVVQTGQMRESDLIVRNITDLTKHKTCLTFYIRTSGTSPQTICYDAVSGFGANLNQVGHIKSDDLVVRKLEDTKNGMFCLTAYVSTPGTSPAVDCYSNKQQFKDHMMEAGHLREGDLDVRQDYRCRQYEDLSGRLCDHQRHLTCHRLLRFSASGQQGWALSGQLSEGRRPGGEKSRRRGE